MAKKKIAKAKVMSGFKSGKKPAAAKPAKAGYRKRVEGAKL